MHYEMNPSSIVIQTKKQKTLVFFTVSIGYTVEK